MTGPGWMFVVDADIAQGAGQQPGDGRAWAANSKYCFKVLEALRTASKHQVVFDARLFDEWHDHMGYVAAGWLADMTTRNRVVRVATADTAWVNGLIRHHLPSQDQKAAQKDAHLVALAHDPGDDRILSNARKARDKFAKIRDERVERIHWGFASKAVVDWLNRGAPKEPDLQLGSRDDPV